MFRLSLFEFGDHVAATVGGFLGIDVILAAFFVHHFVVVHRRREVLFDGVQLGEHGFSLSPRLCAPCRDPSSRRQHFC